jgi:hypothetical protein
VPEHRAVDLVHEVSIDLHDVVGGDPEQLAVIGGVVDLAEAEPVRDDGVSAVLPIADDVRRVEQVGVLEKADGAAPVVGADHASAELWLVQALTDDALRVALLRRGHAQRVRDEAKALVEGDDELATFPVVLDDVDGEDRHVHALVDLAQQDDR